MVLTLQNILNTWNIFLQTIERNRRDVLLFVDFISSAVCLFILFFILIRYFQIARENLFFFFKF